MPLFIHLIQKTLTFNYQTKLILQYLLFYILGRVNKVGGSSNVKYSQPRKRYRNYITPTLTPKLRPIAPKITQVLKINSILINFYKRLSSVFLIREYLLEVIFFFIDVVEVHRNLLLNWV